MDQSRFRADAPAFTPGQSGPPHQTSAELLRADLRQGSVPSPNAQPASPVPLSGLGAQATQSKSRVLPDPLVRATPSSLDHGADEPESLSLSKGRVHASGVAPLHEDANRQGTSSGHHRILSNDWEGDWVQENHALWAEASRPRSRSELTPNTPTIPLLTMGSPVPDRLDFTAAPALSFESPQSGRVGTQQGRVASQGPEREIQGESVNPPMLEGVIQVVELRSQPASMSGGVQVPSPWNNNSIVKSFDHLSTSPPPQYSHSSDRALSVVSDTSVFESDMLPRQQFASLNGLSLGAASSQLEQYHHFDSRTNASRVDHGLQKSTRMLQSQPRGHPLPVPYNPAPGAYFGPDRGRSESASSRSDSRTSNERFSKLVGHAEMPHLDGNGRGNIIQHARSMYGAAQRRNSQAAHGYEYSHTLPASFPQVHNAAFASQSRPLQDWNGQAGAAPNAVGNLASSTKSNELDRTQASILAQAIRDGQFETPPVFDPHHQLRRGTMPSTGAPYPMNTLQMLPFGQANSSTGGSDPLLEHLTRNGRPTVEEAFQHIAFVDRCKNARPMTWGVVKISNIPYGTTKPEIVAHVGRNARLVTQGPPGCPWYGIHIIMERSTAKTMDCFVEFESGEEATQSIQRFHRQCMSGRHPRIGDRHVDLEASSQEALMKELFPRAKCVRWNGQDPEPYQTDEPYNSGFKGFVTSEEMVMTVKHAETPQRSPFAHRCYQRTYESMISTLTKYPWWAANYYTLSERDLLFKAANSLICALREQLREGTNTNQLTPQLLQELVYAALHAPAFSERQRYQLFISAGGPGHVPINMSPLAPYWVFEGLGRREDATEQVVQYYASLLHTATTSSAFLSLAEQSANSAAGTTRSPFGNVVVPYARADKGTYSMARVIQLEWDVIEGLLRKILSPEAAAGGF